MGWSATAAACRTYDRWTDACIARTGEQNTYWHRGARYFYETGREQVDGAIVGSVFRFRGETDLADRVGNFRIQPDGTVKSWPTGLGEQLALRPGDAVTAIGHDQRQVGTVVEVIDGGDLWVSWGPHADDLARENPADLQHAPKRKVTR